VRLVGVVLADIGLHMPDFRAAERTFQLLTQVAGRAGRGDRGGRVIIQTRQPAHHALVHAMQHDVEGFLAAELAQRRSPPYPPDTSLVNLVVSGPEEAPVARRSMQLADWCARWTAAPAGPDGPRSGPLPGGANQGAVALSRRAQGRTEVAGKDRAIAGPDGRRQGCAACDRSGSGWQWFQEPGSWARREPTPAVFAVLNFTAIEPIPDTDLPGDGSNKRPNAPLVVTDPM
jgi:hypothetical protein